MPEALFIFLFSFEQVSAMQAAIKCTSCVAVLRYLGSKKVAQLKIN